MRILVKWTSGAAPNMGLIGDKRLESVVQHLEVWLLKQTDYPEVTALSWRVFGC